MKSSSCLSATRSSSLSSINPALATHDEESIYSKNKALSSIKVASLEEIKKATSIFIDQQESDFIKDVAWEGVTAGTNLHLLRSQQLKSVLDFSSDGYLDANEITFAHTMASALEGFLTNFKKVGIKNHFLQSFCRASYNYIFYRPRGIRKYIQTEEMK